MLLTDSRAHGESGGNRITYGLLEKEDLKRWVSFLTGQDCSSGIFDKTASGKWFLSSVGSQSQSSSAA